MEEGGGERISELEALRRLRPAVAKLGGVPVPAETEITPAMIEAGFSVLSFHYDPDASCKDRREVVRETYLAMRAARHVGSAR